MKLLAFISWLYFTITSSNVSASNRINHRNKMRYILSPWPEYLPICSGRLFCLLPGSFYCLLRWSWDGWVDLKEGPGLKQQASIGWKQNEMHWVRRVIKFAFTCVVPWVGIFVPCDAGNTIIFVPGPLHKWLSWHWFNNFFIYFVYGSLLKLLLLILRKISFGLRWETNTLLIIQTPKKKK